MIRKNLVSAKKQLRVAHYFTILPDILLQISQHNNVAPYVKIKSLLSCSVVSTMLYFSLS